MRRWRTVLSRPITFRTLTVAVALWLGTHAAVDVLARRTATYPGGIKSFTTKSTGQTITAAHINDLQDEVTAIETGLINGLSHAFIANGIATFNGVSTFLNTGLHILDTDASHDLILKPGSNVTADRTLTLTTGDANRTLTLTADTTLHGNPAGYTLQGGSSITQGVAQFDPADGTTYYIGAPGTPIDDGPAGATKRVYFPFAGTLTHARVSILVGTGGTGSSEDGTLNVRLNNTTNLLVTAVARADVNFQTYAVTLSQAVATTDYLEIQWVTPTWSSNPTIVSVFWQVYVD